MRIKNSKIHFSVYIIALSFIVGFTGAWILPNLLSNLIKPIVIIMLIGEVFILKKVRTDTYAKILFMYMILVVICSILNGLESVIALASFSINILYIFMIIIKKYNDNEIHFLLISIKYASLFLAIILIISNPIIGTINSSTIYLLNVQVNKNAIAYLIAPGLYVCIQQLFGSFSGKFEDKKIRRKISIFIEMIILFYAGIYPMSRGGFLCILAPVGIFFVNRYIEAIRKAKIKRIIEGIGLGIGAVFIIWNFIPEQYKNRLLSLENYSYSNSGMRDVLAKQAIELVQGHELIGRGFGYYQRVLESSYGAHNCFVDMYVNAGIIGGVGMIIIFVYPIIKCKNIISYSWISIAFVAAFFESQMSYQLWLPLAMGWLIWKVERERNKIVLKKEAYE